MDITCCRMRSAKGSCTVRDWCRAGPSFLAGSYSNFGWWYYFPIAFLLKTPLALLALFFIGIVSIVRRAGASSPWTERRSSSCRSSSFSASR